MYILHAIFTDFIYEHQPDILTTETWFSDRESAPKTQCTPDGCKFLIILVLVVREEVPDYFFKNNLKVAKVASGERQSFQYSEWKVTSGIFYYRLQTNIFCSPPGY